jgi:glutamate-5-semialdehyde dehydrogenase
MTTVSVDAPTAARHRIERAHEAARGVGLLTDAQKAEALRAIADAIEAATDDIVAANAVDLERGERDGLSDGLLDRLRLDRARSRPSPPPCATSPSCPTRSAACWTSAR